MANLDITIRAKPQDGSSRVRIGEDVFDLRISFLPTFFGEKVVIRVLESQGAMALAGLGMREKDLAEFERLLSMPQGLILVTGPTGSGKTTTLYAVLQRLLSPEINIVTIEDPIEYSVHGINQVQVNPARGLTFAKGLRSLLRQDPNVVMIGEIRDLETATIALQAAQTGHLVLSTLHTNDAVGAVTFQSEQAVEWGLHSGEFQHTAYAALFLPLWSSQTHIASALRQTQKVSQSSPKPGIRHSGIWSRSGTSFSRTWRDEPGTGFH